MMTHLKSKMVVILTNREDITADYVILELRRRKIDFFRFNTEDFPLKTKLVLKFKNNSYEGFFSNTEIVLPFSNIKSIWYRRPSLPSFENILLDAGTKDFCIKESYATIDGVWSLLDCFWLSHPLNIRKAENKLLQLKIASEIGLIIPATLISNNPLDIKKFFYENHESLIVKPVKNAVFKSNNIEKIIFTSQITSSDISKIQSSTQIPSIYQKKIEKKYDIRVTVIGENVFSTEIHSQDFNESSVDWRMGENIQIIHKKHQLPLGLESRCITLTKKFGLEFAAIDFVLATDGNYYFLEINPNGQWAWIEERTGHKLTKSIVDLLCSKK